MEIKSNSNIKKNADHQLSKMECNAMRGIAILGIVLHNYCHWLAPIVKENEYQYNQHNVDWLNQVMSAEWSSLTLFHVISFFGHYGVPIFLFLSAYGLVMKYEHPKTGNTSEPTAISFIKYHWIKLFRMMIVGFAAFILIDAITPGQHRYTVLDIIGQLGLFNNASSSSRRHYLAWSLLVLWFDVATLYCLSPLPLQAALELACSIHHRLYHHPIGLRA